MRQKKQRFWEIDLLRGIAVIMMIIYHILFDIDFLTIYTLSLHHISFQIFLYPIGTLFLLLVGISLILSYNQYQNMQKQTPPFKKYFTRGIILFFLALGITGVTWIYPHEGFIVFGVIHCISISIILSYPFITKPKIALILGSILIFIGVWFSTITVDNPYLFWMGLNTRSFYTLDYFPLLPWFGVVLIGLFSGQKIYPILQNKYQKPQKTPTVFIPLTILGNHSLIVYLLHQPILFGLLFIFFS